MGSSRWFFCLLSILGVLAASGCRAALLLLGLWATDVVAKPKVLASIKPLALIAQEVVGDQAEVQILLPVTASAHDYPLKMSDHRRVRDADLVLWVGAELESFLARPLAKLPAQQLLEAYELGGLFWPIVEDHGHQHTSQDKRHQHAGKDPHIWLDPRNAAVIAKALAQRLGQIAPESALYFAANAERFAQSLVLLDEQLKTQLAPLKGVGFAVYHEGYSHFVAHYSLHQLAYVTFTPERRPGAKHLQELRAVLAKEGHCVFLEPYQSDRALRELAAALELKIGLLDAIGTNQVSSYRNLMEQLGQSFSACLANRANYRAVD